MKIMVLQQSVFTDLLTIRIFRQLLNCGKNDVDYFFDLVTTFENSLKVKIVEDAISLAKEKYGIVDFITINSLISAVYQIIIEKINQKYNTKLQLDNQFDVNINALSSYIFLKDEWDQEFAEQLTNKQKKEIEVIFEC